MSRVGIIGTGHIAVSIARIMASKGYELHATEHKSWVSSALKVELGASISAAQDVIDASELIFLCLHPLIAADVLKPLTFHADQQIVSIMAAISENELATICAPVSGFVRTIPLRFLQTGGCPLAAFGNDRLLADLSEPQLDFVQKTLAFRSKRFRLWRFTPKLAQWAKCSLRSPQRLVIALGRTTTLPKFCHMNQWAEAGRSVYLLQ